MAEYFINSEALGADQSIIPIHICRPNTVGKVLKELSSAQRTYAQAHKFTGLSGQSVLVPNKTGDIALVLFGAGAPSDGYADSALQAGTLAKKLGAGLL